MFTAYMSQMRTPRSRNAADHLLDFVPGGLFEMTFSIMGFVF